MLRQLPSIILAMRAWLITIGLLVGVFAQAQDQSSCPIPRERVPTSNCTSGDVKRNIKVNVAALIGAGIDADTMFDAVERVQRHSYRPCDLGLEVTERVKESFQRLGYFCANVGPIALQQNGKDQYEIRIHVHPGAQYRVGECTFTGATLLSADELKSALHMKPDSPFNTESVRRGIENVQKSYAKKGHPNVTAIPVASLDEKNKKIAIEIKIQESVASQ